MKGVLTLLILAGIAAAYFFLPDQARHAPAAAASPHHYSEPGVAYTTGYVALHLPGGVSGLAPGTRVVECLDVHVPGKEVVSNGAYTFTVEPQTLTHDIDLAHALAAADEQDQGRALSSLAHSQEQRAANAYSANLLTAQDVEQINAATVAASAVGNYDSGLHRPVATVNGAYGGSYGGGGPSYYDSTSISSITINQYGSGAGARGGGAGTVSSRPNASRVATTRSIAPMRGLTGPVAGTFGAVGGTQ